MVVVGAVVRVPTKQTKDGIEPDYDEVGTLGCTPIEYAPDMKSVLVRIYYDQAGPAPECAAVKAELDVREQALAAKVKRITTDKFGVSKDSLEG